MKRGRRIESLTVFVTVDVDGDEAIGQISDGLMIVAHDRERLERFRRLAHDVAIRDLMRVAEVVFVRASGERFHTMHDAPDDPVWYRGTRYAVIEIDFPCTDPHCHREHAYLNYAANRAVDAARGRKLKRRRR